MSGLTLATIAIAVILSAVVSLVGTSARRRAVAEGRARAADLCELTGLLEPRALQDVFGPPTLNGVYHVSLESVQRARRPLGRVMSWDAGDGISVGVALLSFIWSGPVMSVFVATAAIYQIAGWLVASRLPRV